MMPVRERNLNHPGAIGLPFHRMRFGLPIIEIAEQRHAFGFGRVTNEIDGDREILGGITAGGTGGVRATGIHWYNFDNFLFSFFRAQTGPTDS